MKGGSKMSIAKELEINRDTELEDLTVHIWVIERNKGKKDNIIFHEFISVDHVREGERVIELSTDNKPIMVIMKHEYNNIKLNF